MIREEALAMLDWTAVQDFFRKNGPGGVTFSVRKVPRRSVELRWSVTKVLHEKPKTKKGKK